MGKSIQQRAKQYAEMVSMGKKGQVINTATSVFVGLFIFVLIVFVVLYGISALNPGGFFTAGSANQNATNNLVANVTGAVGEFGTQIPTAAKILGVVLVLGFLALLIVIVVRFRSSSGTGGGSL